MSFYCILVLKKKVVLRLLWLLVLKWPNYLNCLRSGTKIWKSKSACVRRRESAIIMLSFWKGTFVCIAANSHPLSSKSKLKEMRVVKLYSMCYPWLSCSKSNWAVQIVAVQNYEPIWFQFSQFEAPSWPICTWRDVTIQYKRHILLAGRRFSGLLMLNPVSKDAWNAWCKKIRNIQAGWIILKKPQT